MAMTVQLELALIVKSTYTAVMNDFIAKLGRQGKAMDTLAGERNDGGDRMATLAEINKLFVCGTWFRKKTTKTLIVPDAENKNEID